MKSTGNLTWSPAFWNESTLSSQGSAQQPKEEFRAYWADAFHDGFKTPEQVDQLIEDAKQSNVNALIVQVRRRGDAYFNKSLEPRTQDPTLQPGFDTLAYLLDKAHSSNPRIEVHAWLATLPIWNSLSPPVDSNHVFNQHGPSAEGKSYWLMDSYDGANRSGADYVLDPGHPDAVDYTVDQYVNVVRQYPVDGIHLDLVRYMGPEWGYNPTSLERYRKESGTTGKPRPDDPRWMDWRRKQVDHLMRKVYLESVALRPEVKVSAAVIAWGKGPSTLEEYQQSRPYTEVMQDWNGWLQEGIVDLILPMNYDREHVPDQKQWYDQWIAWEKDNQHGRHIAAGPGIYLNSIEGSLAQIGRAQAPSEKGNHLTGVSLYCYAETDKDSLSRSLFIHALTQPNEYGKPVFTEPAIPPKMKWKAQPTTGGMKGWVRDPSGLPLDGVKVTLKGRNHQIYRLESDGSGFFGKTELPPGQYMAKVDNLQATGHPIKITPGKVTSMELRVRGR